MNEKRIEQVILHFKGKLESILALGNEGETPLDDTLMFKKTLAMSLLDALSNIIYGSKDNRKRFVTFLEKFGDWPDGARMSIPHLHRALELDLSPDLELLRLHIRDELDTWRKSNGEISLGNDIEKAKVIDLFPSGADHRLIGIDIPKFNHYNLMYESRNGLVHEFRELGYGFEDLSSKSPFYHQSPITINSNKEPYSWELVYPFEFVVSLIKTTLKNLESYLKRNDLNPDRHIRFGSYFFSKMNPEIL